MKRISFLVQTFGFSIHSGFASAKTIRLKSMAQEDGLQLEELRPHEF